MKIRKYVVLSHFNGRDGETILLVDEQSFADEGNDPDAFMVTGHGRYVRTIELCGKNLQLLPDVFAEEKN